ncbi:MAG: cytochrome o ubiquinol oxidase subunit IV [Asticcacaulis sp.]
MHIPDKPTVHTAKDPHTELADHHATDKLNHGHGHDHGPSHGSVKSYLIGFVLSVILTAIPFALTMLKILPASSLIPVILILGVVQILVHLHYFLHMDTSSSQIWNNAAFVFTVIIVGILIIGTIWVMFHLNHNMAPGMMPMGGMG